MSASRASMVSPTPATRVAVGLVAAIILATGMFLLRRYASLPGLLPVHFQRNGFPNGWQFKTVARVMLPVFVQIALAVT